MKKSIKIKILVVLVVVYCLVSVYALKDDFSIRIIMGALACGLPIVLLVKIPEK